MFAGFEVRVWEADEDLGELMAGEEVREKFHGVAAEGRDVFEGAGEESGGEAAFCCCGLVFVVGGCSCGWLLLVDG